METRPLDELPRIDVHLPECTESFYMSNTEVQAYSEAIPKIQAEGASFVLWLQSGGGALKKGVLITPNTAVRFFLAEDVRAGDVETLKEIERIAELIFNGAVGSGGVPHSEPLFRREP